MSPHWLPRRTYAGTYDAAWEEGRAPYLPADFDARFLQVAPEGLVVPGHLRGGEPVQALGVSPEGPLQFSVPVVPLEVVYRLDPGREVHPAVLDTLILEPDARRLVLVWRAAFASDKRTLRVREIRARFAGPA